MSRPYSIILFTTEFFDNPLCNYLINFDMVLKPG